jgi:proton-translocating NAD(P)+ transhydrogenase subunit alpha
MPTIGVLKETYPGERRVAIIPASIPNLKKAGLDVLVERGAGTEAGFTDPAYEEKGARLVSRAEALEADVLLQVRTATAAGETGAAEIGALKKGQVVIGLAEPFGSRDLIEGVARRGATLLAMELMPRITRAQSMDVLSSMATISGYKAVLLAASHLPRMFPMMMTAAGNLAPARAFIVGAGVAGLQAIASARRLGAVVEAFDVRPAVKEQVHSLGAKFVELPLETKDAEDKGGYAKAQDETFYQRQREMMARVVAANDVVITTALIPGKKSPVLITKEMVAGMTPGSVIVDLAAERGGNCELTQPDRVVVEHNVTILGPTNLPSTVPHHASQMYSKNISTFLLHLVKDGQVQIQRDDEITKETLMTADGDIVHPRVREALGLVASRA